MKRFKHILVAYDGSNSSSKALEMTATIAKDQEAKVTVLFIHETDSENMVNYARLDSINHFGATTSNPQLGPEPMNISTPYQETDEENNRVDIVLEDAKSKWALDTEPIFDTIIGNPADEITQYVDDYDVDLVVMGHRGLSGIKKLMMGSVSQKVTNQANCSVFVVK